jgi:hypothetical protein
MEKEELGVIENDRNALPEENEDDDRQWKCATQIREKSVGERNQKRNEANYKEQVPVKTTRQTKEIYT